MRTSALKRLFLIMLPIATLSNMVAWRNYQAICSVVKNYGLNIGYKMAQKMKTGGYFVELFVESACQHSLLA